MAAIASFLVGSAAIVAPWPFGIPIAVTASAGKMLVQRRRVRSAAKVASDLGQHPHAASSGSNGPPPVVLSWSNVGCELTDKHGATKALLRGVSGSAQPGRLLALLGPSGSGKTTLLNALAGQVPTTKGLELTGTLLVNGQAASHSQHGQGYVQQDDVFYSMLTVLETLRMAAKLRLPATLTPAEKDAVVDRVLRTLGLTKVKNTRVGDAKTRGLSGGEKKRLSLACELIASPSLLFLDEPTSGLDAAAAEKVMATLKALAHAGHTVVCSIHQPRSSIFEMFDDLILLNEGQLVYHGPASEALPYFASHKHVCPPNYNPAEFLSDLISADYYAPAPGGKAKEEDNNQEEAVEAARARVRRLIQAWAAHQATQSEPAGLAAGASSQDLVVLETTAKPTIGWGRQFRLLATRSWRQVVRDKSSIKARVIANVASAIIFASIYWRLGRKQGNIQDRMGLMQVVAINTAMGSLSKTLNVFPRERVIVNRERARRAYEVAPYLAGKLLAELPISAVFPALFGTLVYPACGLNPSLERFVKFLGAVTLSSFASSAFGLTVGSFAPSTEAAMAIGPAAMTVWIVFGGYYVQSVPAIFSWLPKASLIKQAFSALCVNEFAGTTFEADKQGHGMTTGQQVLEWLNFGDITVRGRLVQQMRITIFYYWATYSILCANKPRFSPMLPPRPAKPSVWVPSASAKSFKSKQEPLLAADAQVEPPASQ